jgi:RimJ/RimL family protein N-acetyltransferase
MRRVNEADDRPILNLIGEKVALGPLRRDLLPLYERWINDFNVLRNLGGEPRPMTADAEAAWFERASTSSDQVLFTIYERGNLRPIGTTDLRQIDHANGTAMFGILIGVKELWGHGYGTEATRLMLEYAFHVVGVHNVMLTVFPRNERGVRAYRRAGFREIGRQREAHRSGGVVEDILFMDCLSTEFERPIVKWEY